MKLFNLTLLATATALSQTVMAASQQQQQEQDPTRTPFSSTFHQPSPPLLQQEFRAHYNQHKWDTNVSNIASGFLYNSPLQQKVRVDEVFDGALGSSLFDYTNTTDSGTVSNRQWILSPNVASDPSCFVDFVVPGFPLLSEDYLLVNRAVFAGKVEDRFAGWVDRWDFLFQGAVPVSVYLNGENVVQGYDFVGPETRARTVTRFFNIILGDIDKEVFEFPC